MLDITGQVFTVCGHWAGTQMSGRGGPLLWVLLSAGLTGAFVHCVSMCGGFVLTQQATLAEARGDAGFWARLLLPYHAGRLGTYATLGALSAGGGSLILHAPEFQLVSRLILAGVAMLFFFTLIERLSLFEKLGLRLPFRMPAQAICGFKALAQLLKTRSWIGRLGLGAMLGLLPCVMLFSALLLVATTGNPVTGALGLLAFGLGTIPALSLAGFGAGRVLTLNVKVRDAMTLGALGVNGLVLFGLAVF